jgi:hypothetical protein
MANITFNGVGIGDHGWVEISTTNEVEVHKIPRADGAILRRRGGGLKTLTVNAWIKRDKRSDVEKYFNELAGALTSDIADLIVNDVTYSNCLLQNIAADPVHNNWARFTVTFLKSGD